MPTIDDLPPFRNERVRAYRDASEQEAFARGFQAARREIGCHVPLVIGGERRVRDAVIRSLNPANPDELIGAVSAASTSDVDDALEAASAAFADWSRTSVQLRAQYLLRAAAAIREERDVWNGLMALEVGKTPVEADADSGEAIDFLEYYAREALRLNVPNALVPSPLPEVAELRYLPVGVGVVIPPWNFPLAIMAGMTAAALVTGNTVVLKPSPDAAVVASRFVALLERLGIPPGVVNFVPGDPVEVGERLVVDRRTRFVSFTGSKKVGLRINEVAARTPPGQRWIKRVVAELGGKDAIVVAADADVEAAVAGVVASAFGFAGQKCSACSRVIVEQAVYHEFLELLVERVRGLRIGEPSDPQTDVGPVINAAARERILAAIERGSSEAQLVLGGLPLAGRGYYIEPTIFADVPPAAQIAQEEIFGPVLAVMRARNFAHALELANDSEFGLTGSVYTRDLAQLEQARETFFVGNLYLNRKCTGALVGVHPFGGFNLSGTDSKAGGPDYLPLFQQAKTIVTARTSS